MNYYPLLRVRSWNNGTRCMYFYILIIKTWWISWRMVSLKIVVCLWVICDEALPFNQYQLAGNRQPAVQKQCSNMSMVNGKDCCIPIVNALEILQSCTEPSIYQLIVLIAYSRKSILIYRNGSETYTFIRYCVYCVYIVYIAVYYLAGEIPHQVTKSRPDFICDLVVDAYAQSNSHYANI